VPPPARSILLVAQLSPPSPLVAARRVHGLTKYLARLGHSVTVLTSAVSGEGPIEGAARVVRTRDLMATRLNWRRGHFAALTAGSGSYRRPSQLQSVVVPDLALAGWLPFALPRALALARETELDCVITTSPPESTHLVGRALAGRLPWIAELRDGWTFEPPRAPWPLDVQSSANASLERRLLGRADAVVAVTRPIVDDLEQRLGRKAVLLTNGFDPDQVPSGDAGEDPLLDPQRHSFAHTGRVEMGGASLEPLLDALARLEGEPVELVLAGPLSAEEERLLAERNLGPLVRAVGALEHGRALELQRAADTLLVVTQGAARPSVATGKLFEYLAAGRPILVLGEETEAARIVRETGAGSATSATDPELIAAALRAPPEAAPSGVDAYSYAELAVRYSELVEEVVASRKGASAAATSPGA
jgi:glycosyltransferase involved in cell wall biosynthesis